jgi:hypothetical protein
VVHGAHITSGLDPDDGVSGLDLHLGDVIGDWANLMVPTEYKVLQGENLTSQNLFMTHRGLEKHILQVCHHEKKKIGLEGNGLKMPNLKQLFMIFIY